MCYVASSRKKNTINQLNSICLCRLSSLDLKNVHNDNTHMYRK